MKCCYRIRSYSHCHRAAETAVVGPSSIAVDSELADSSSAGEPDSGCLDSNSGLAVDSNCRAIDSVVDSSDSAVLNSVDATAAVVAIENSRLADSTDCYSVVCRTAVG